jgi:hypothetical protein
MECDSVPARSRMDAGVIADLRGIPLENLAAPPSDADSAAAAVADRILEGAQSLSRVQAASFNSAI